MHNQMTKISSTDSPQNISFPYTLIIRKCDHILQSTVSSVGVQHRCKQINSQLNYNKSVGLKSVQ